MSPVLIHALTRLQRALPGSHCVVVVHPDYVAHTDSLLNEYGCDNVAITTGGDTRWQSVKNALDMTTDMGLAAKVITVHDGARPLVTSEVAQNVIKACASASGAIPAIAVTDSLRRTLPGGDSEAVDRKEFRAVQTPQAFQADKLRHAYTLPYTDSFTDDASVMTAAGFSDITLVDGDPRNIKITMPCDIDIASLYLHSMQ